MPPAASVQVVGLKAFMRDLNRMGDPNAGALVAAMRDAGRQAAQPVADAVRSAYPQGRTGRLRGSVRVTASKTGAAVRAGRKSVPYAGPVDFGGYPQGRQYIPNGRYLYPAMEQHQAQAAAAYEAAITRAVASFSWTNSGDVPHD